MNSIHLTFSPFIHCQLISNYFLFHFLQFAFLCTLFVVFLRFLLTFTITDLKLQPPLFNPLRQHFHLSQTSNPLCHSFFFPLPLPPSAPLSTSPSHFNSFLPYSPLVHLPSPSLSQYPLLHHHHHTPSPPHPLHPTIISSTFTLHPHQNVIVLPRPRLNTPLFSHHYSPLQHCHYQRSQYRRHFRSSEVTWMKKKNGEKREQNENEGRIKKEGRKRRRRVERREKGRE